MAPSSLLGQRLGPWVRGPGRAGVLTLHRGPVRTHGEARASPPLPAQPDRPPPGKPTAAVASLGSHPGLDPHHQRAHARGASPVSWGGGAVSHTCGPAQPWKEPEGKVPKAPGGVGRRGRPGRGGGEGLPRGWRRAGKVAHGEPHADPQGARPMPFSHSPMGITRTHTHRHAHTHTDSHM